MLEYLELGREPRYRLFEWQDCRGRGRGTVVEMHLTETICEVRAAYRVPPVAAPCHKYQMSEAGRCRDYDHNL
jgi:hypothetical protein